MSIYDEVKKRTGTPANTGKKGKKSTMGPTKKPYGSDYPRSHASGLKGKPANTNAAPGTAPYPKGNLKPKKRVKTPKTPSVSSPAKPYRGGGGGGGGIYDISRPVKNAARNYMKPEKLF